MPFLSAASLNGGLSGLPPPVMTGGLHKQEWGPNHANLIPKVAARMVMGGLAKSTQARYSGAFQHYSDFSQRMSADSGEDWPVMLTGEHPGRDEDHLVNYVAYQGWMQGCSAATVKGKLGAIRWYHVHNRLANPLQGKPRLTAALLALKRLRGESKSKQAVSPEMLVRIKDCLDFTLEEHIVLWAALLLAFFFLMRSSEYCAKDGELDPAKGLTVWKLQCDDANGNLTDDFSAAVAVTVLFEASKTDQNKIGCTRTSYRAEGELDLIEALQRVRAMRGNNWDPNDPVLMTNARKIITRGNISNALKAVAGDMGLEETEVASHSLRIGGATALHAAGWTDEAIRRFGRWQSDCWRRYVYSNRAESCGVAQAMADARYELQPSAANFRAAVGVVHAV